MTVNSNLATDLPAINVLSDTLTKSLVETGFTSNVEQHKKTTVMRQVITILSIFSSFVNIVPFVDARHCTKMF